MTRSTDTIAALASGFGRSGVAVVRISGAGSRFVLETMVGGLPEPRRLSLRPISDPATGELLDRGLVAWFPGPHSFTGEDAAEFHLHGSRAVIAAVLAAVTGLPDCRVAEPGEFTRRAFLAGKLDLSSVEGLADLIDAETEAQRRQALRQMDGALAQRVENWRGRLLHALALAEAELDFVDEADVPEDLLGEALVDAASVRGEIAVELAKGRGGERLREGFTVVITGPPNAGKSTLLNALAHRPAAIVSPIPGTTRDIIEVHCDLGGLPVVLVDTAGLRDTRDPIEQEGVDRARARAATADLVLRLSAIDSPPELPCQDDAGVLHVCTKADLGTTTDGRGLVISALTGAGLDELLAAIRERAAGALGGGQALITRERHRHALTDTVEALDRAASAAEQRLPAELIAEDLRLAARALGRVTGRVDVDDVLDRIFSSFCIGK
ncbi:tRNA uridine-5-carboxymethylaminomethyl(34) synthesis GTPase MnmE [Chelatococcus sp. SYSU_G07232]|uniref:tRNA modification GTPase MnmE n=1 Tax=Chelatococcus albus TaxID=3047466 RepID=A0ABT7AH58_9HYPH|nr:tRNA uridine-5-carboxymethylaminomethyl(34) synthesis GTPase MnmE [Chelatococcus sp. SYSU_G07232]MDJ1158712.1 tRNA uridine-5-carboxymethylaminomethyl(34) synthesis GTPase MnmE [Chelatococcus sp. SYSU_G07232]